MSNPLLTKEELAKANDLLNHVREEIARLAGGNPKLLFAYRRRVAKMLVYDERSGPNERRKLKIIKRKEQEGLCAECRRGLPKSYNVLDRFAAIDGYTVANTRLICEDCDQSIQVSRVYK